MNAFLGTMDVTMSTGPIYLRVGCVMRRPSVDILFLSEVEVVIVTSSTCHKPNHHNAGAWRSTTTLPAIQRHKCMTGQNVFEIAVVSGARMVLDCT